MKRKVDNYSESYCFNCGAEGTATLVDSTVVCSICGLDLMFSMKTNDVFIPKFVAAKNFKRNQYCPSLPERRKVDRATGMRNF